MAGKKKAKIANRATEPQTKEKIHLVYYYKKKPGGSLGLKRKYIPESQIEGFLKHI